MTIKEQLRANFPKTVNKAAPIFSSMIANDDGTGAFEYELNYLISFMKEWVSTPNVYGQSGEMLEKTVEFFSFLERFTDESEKSLKGRFRAIFVRNKVWGNSYDVKSVFEQYFPSAEIFLVENTNDTSSENLISDGDFTEYGSQDWNLTGCTLSEAARFSKTYGVLIPNGSSLKQTVSVKNIEDKTYFLHFFLKGDVKVLIKNNANKYWNSSSKTWTDSISYSHFNSEEWKNCSVFFFTNSSIEDIEIEFIGNGTQAANVDYIRLFEKKPYASFTIVVHFAGDSGMKAMKLAPGNADPTDKIKDYKKYDYFDHAFITGVAAGFAQDIYNDLLNLLRAQGVKAYLEIVVKDYIEE